MHDPPEYARQSDRAVRRSSSGAVALGVATALILATALLMPATAATETSVVKVTDNNFGPDGLRVPLGRAVRWQDAASGEHNVREDSRIFRSGAPTTNLNDFTVRFSAGTYHYYCEIHGSRRAAGMDGVIRVAPKAQAGPSGLPFTVLWATDDSNSGATYDVDYKIGSRRWTRWKSGTKAINAVFGQDGNPVEPKAGIRYSFRARSLKASSASGWSPEKDFMP